DTVDELHVVWQATHQGWLTTWSLQLVGSAERDATPLSSVWPKPGHVYTARLDLVPQMQAMSVYLYNETEDVPVYTGLIHLPEGNWHLIEPADALPNRGVDVIRAHTSTGPDPGPARLHGLPASLQQRLNLSVHTVSDARPVQSVLPDEPVVASFAWPSTPVPGVVEFVVETADGASVALGSSPWSET